MQQLDNRRLRQKGKSDLCFEPLSLQRNHNPPVNCGHDDQLIGGFFVFILPSIFAGGCDNFASYWVSVVATSHLKNDT